MKWLLGIIMSGSVLAWAAQPPATAPAADAPTTRPASGRSMSGPRNRPLLDGKPWRDMGPMGRRGPNAQNDPLPPEKIEQVMRFTRENFPQIHERLLKLRQIDPQAFREIVRKLRAHLESMLDDKNRDPEFAQKFIEEHKMQLRIIELGKQYRQAGSEEDKTRIKTELSARLREQFDANQKRIQQDIDNLRHRLDDQEHKLADREQRKEQILRHQLDIATNRARPGRDANADQ